MSFKASTVDYDFLSKKVWPLQNEWFALCEHTIMDFIEILTALHVDTILKRILC